MTNEALQVAIDAHELVKRHFKPLKLRAIRMARNISLTAIGDKMGLSNTHIVSIELGHLFKGYKRKDELYAAYGVDPQDIEPSLTDIDRLSFLYLNYTREELQMALDLQTADQRTAKYKANRRKSFLKYKEEYKAIAKREHRIRNV